MTSRIDGSSSIRRTRPSISRPPGGMASRTDGRGGTVPRLEVEADALGPPSSSPSRNEPSSRRCSACSGSAPSGAFGNSSHRRSPRRTTRKHGVHGENERYAPTWARSSGSGAGRGLGVAPSRTKRVSPCHSSGGWPAARSTTSRQWSHAGCGTRCWSASHESRCDRSGPSWRVRRPSLRRSSNTRTSSGEVQRPRRSAAASAVESPARSPSAAPRPRPRARLAVGHVRAVPRRPRRPDERSAQLGRRPPPVHEHHGAKVARRLNAEGRHVAHHPAVVAQERPAVCDAGADRVPVPEALLDRRRLRHPCPGAVAHDAGASPEQQPGEARHVGGGRRDRPVGGVRLQPCRGDQGDARVPDAVVGSPRVSHGERARSSFVIAANESAIPKGLQDAAADDLRIGSALDRLQHQAQHLVPDVRIVEPGVRRGAGREVPQGPDLSERVGAAVDARL